MQKSAIRARVQYSGQGGSLIKTLSTQFITRLDICSADSLLSKA
jgi:hypothetical protein